MRNLALLSATFLGLVASAAPSHAAQIMVGQCLENDTCWTSGAVWSDTLSLTDLESLGLGSDVPLVVTQTSEYVIRLGVTTANFTTTSGPFVATIFEFNGPGSYNDPGPFPGPLVVGFFPIPDNATGLVISGTFGNSVIGSSSGANVCVGYGPCGAAAPEPSTWAMLGLGFAACGLVGYRRTRRPVVIEV
jgi:PEP-CTERM motif